MPFSALAGDTHIEGRVLLESGPLAGATVSAYRTYDDIQAAKPVITSEPTDDQGRYSFRLTAGEYYFVARGAREGKTYFSYMGANPVFVATGNAWLSFPASEVKQPVYRDGPTSIRGIVTYKGKPVKGAFVALYTAVNKRFRGLGFRTDSVDENGSFDLPVPPNNYVVIARKMGGKGTIRPLENGDLFCYSPANPIEVRTDKVVEITVPCYPKGDRMGFAETPVIKANDYPTVEDLMKQYRFGIKGRVTDIAGKPVPNIHVLAYRGEWDTVFMMFHVSHGTEFAGKTDKDGYYFIPVDADGSYHLIARSVLGGSPKNREHYGLYGGNPRHMVYYKTGQIIDNINIVVGESMAEENDYRIGDPIRVNGGVYMTDAILDKDTIWNGNIEIHGTVWIKRGVTLMVEPGTVVKFKRQDRDNNGIGDGEIIVEGRIIAKGTRKNRIEFTSAEEKPEPKDWSYLLFLATGSDSLIEYCEFRYAYSGMQIHYSKAHIRHSRFVSNTEGIRYNRSNVVIEHNSFADNEMAIRFVRLEGKAEIRYNSIHGNEVGIIFMQPHGKTVNFYLDPPAAGLDMPVVENNNILDNDYNYKLGERRAVSLDVSRNWWGTLDPAVIDEHIYDRKDDDSLGEIRYAPFLRKRVPDAGALL